MFKSSTNSAFSPIKFFGVPVAFAQQVKQQLARHPHPEQFALALTTFANLGLLRSGDALHNLSFISRFANLWFAEDERADSKRLFQELTPDGFDQTRFDELINATRYYQQEESTPHGIRFRLCIRLLEMLDTPLHPVGFINLPGQITYNGLGYPEPPTSQTNFPPPAGR